MSTRYPGLYKRGSIWWYKATVNGKLFRASTHCTNEEYAWAYSERWRGLKKSARKHGAANWDVFKEEYFSLGVAGTAPITVYNKQWSVREFERVCPIKLTAEFTPQALQKAVNTWVTEKKWSANTIDVHAIHLKTIGKYAQRAGYLAVYDWAQIKRISRVTRRQDYFTVEEAMRIINAEKKSRINHAFLMLLFWGNMRRGEATHARWDWLDKVKREILIQPDGSWQPKAEQDRRLRRLPVAQQLWDYLMQLGKTAKGPYIVEDENGWRPASEHSWSCRMKDLSRRVGAKVYCHKFRHSIITGMDNDGENPAHIQQASRHLHYATTQGYTHPTTDNARRALQGFADRHWPKR